MRFWLFILFGLLINSCDSPQQSKPVAVPTEDDPVVAATDFGFNPQHPNAEQFSFFLNHYTEKFLPLELKWVEWKKQALIQERFAFQTERSGTTVYLIFCATQDDCITVCSLNFEPTTEKLLWGVNGAVAFVISGDDPDIVADLAGYFAGEE